MRIQLLAVKLALGMALFAAPAQSAVIQLVDGVTYGPIADGDLYTTAGTLTGSYMPGSGAFVDSFSFIYDAPPDLGTISTTTNNLVADTYGIADFTFDWSFNGSSILSGAGLYTDLVLPLFGDGTYTLTLSGTPKEDGGQYTASLAVSAVPLPGAVVLFGTVLAGLGLIQRRRKFARSAVALAQA